MKRNSAAAPYLSVCMIVRNSAKKPYDHDWSFEKTLQGIRERFPAAELVIVDTQSSDETPEIAKRYADVFDSYKGPREDWTQDMLAFDDAAAARARSFTLASGKWVLWIDDDDQIPGAEETERLLKLNGRWREQAFAPGQRLVEPSATPIWAEDILRHIESKYPEVECLVCPYAYQTDAQGLAVGGQGWQDRERFVKRRADGSFGWWWQESAHEILVPRKAEDFKGLHAWPSLLFWHHKLWTAAEQNFTVRRHGKILLDRYAQGERNTRNLIYLATFATTSVFPDLPPMREKLIDEAVAYATTPTDHVRAYVMRGNFETERGFYNEAKAAYASAVAFRPDLPDGWLAGANAAMQFEDYAWAVEFYRKAVECRVTVESQVNPRSHTLETPAMLIAALSKVADAQNAVGAYHNAQGLLDEAKQLGAAIWRSPAVGPDMNEAQSIWASACSRADGQRAVMALRHAWEFLVHNDETQKALTLIDAMPNVAEDHPIKIELEAWAQKMRLHLSDEKAYYDFYAAYADGENPSPAVLFDERPLERAEYASAWIRAQGRAIDALEIGPFDGVIGIPILRNCPNLSTYTAVDADTRALDRFRLRADKEGFGPKLRVFQAQQHTDWPVKGYFDAVICYEMIEHVPDPVALVRALLERVRYGSGRLFISTPWKAFDKSQPINFEKRDPRGHVRAMTLRDMARVVEAAGGEIEDAYRARMPSLFEIGAAMHVRVRPKTVRVELPPMTGVTTMSIAPIADEPRPVVFAVPSALWPWNDTMVEHTGMGASENMIVKLARELAKTRRVEVYGPVPEEEVRHGVRYWPLAQLRFAPRGSILVTSRAPSWTKRQLKAFEIEKRFSKRILWLQDVGYPDLDQAVADYYNKIVVLTDWHRGSIHQLNAIDTADKSNVRVIGNFLIPDLFESPIGVLKEDGTFAVQDVERRPHHFIYSSSPDRGLIPILRLWPHVLRAYPDATLDIFYGWTGCKKLTVGNPAWTTRYREVRREFDELKWQKGVRDCGRINGRQLAVEMRSAAVWFYPSYGFEESGCATAFEMRAAGCVPVVPPIAALPETAASEWTQWLPDENEWRSRMSKSDHIRVALERITAAIEIGPEARATMAKQAIEKHALSAELPKWLALFDEET